MGSILIETLIAAPRARCFDLALDVEVHARTAAFSGERLVPPGRMSGRLALNDLVAFQGRHFGIRQRFVARITQLDRPRQFTDEMTEGVFHWLRHVHEFHEIAGGTLMRDVVEWRAPLGFIADPLFLRRHMEWFIRTKQKNLKEEIERSQ